MPSSIRKYSVHSGFPTEFPATFSKGYCPNKAKKIGFFSFGYYLDLLTSTHIG
jgi:hypothetical protein